MTVTTVFSTAPGGDGSVQSTNTTYATARSGSTLINIARHNIGQNFLSSNYTCREAFVIFDTSTIPDTDDVSAVTLSMDGNTDGSTTDFNAKVAADDYDGGEVLDTDWVDGTTLSALTVLASWASSGYSAGYNAFTETADFKTAINKTGNTAIIIFSDRHAAGTTPTGSELVIFEDADDVGTTTDPKLDITHAAAAGGTTRLLAMMGVGT